MSKKQLGRLSQSKIFTVKEWEDADILGRIEISILNPKYFQLSGDEEKYFSRLKKCFHILSDCNSEIKAYRLMKEVFPAIQHREIYKIISDTQKYFSRIIERNVEFDRIMQTDRILKHIEGAKREGDFKAVARLEKIYAEIRQTDQLIESNEKWNNLQLPEVELTSDPKVLFEDAEVEEVDE